MEDESAKRSKSSYVGVGCMTLFGLPFAAVGVWQAWSLGAMLWLAAESRSWVETPATVLSTELESHRGDESDTFEVLAEYQYTFNGQVYTNDRVGLDTGSDNVSAYHKRWHKRLEKAFQTETPVSCYVDPNKPSRSLLDRQIRPLMVVFRLPFVICFTLAGVGIIVGAWYGARMIARMNQLKAAAPESPWLWRDDWAAGEIRSSNRMLLLTSGGSALFWNGISFPAAALFLFGDKAAPWWVGLIVALFPAIGCGLLVWFGKNLLRWYRFGMSTLRLAQTPGVIGGKLAGVILASSKIDVAEEVRLTLICQRTKESGDNETRYVAWQDERLVAGFLDPGEPGRVGIPVDLTIPSDGVMATDAEDRVAWTLKAAAALPGIDYEAEFEVPIFRTEDSQDGVTLEAAPTGAFERDIELAELLNQEGIRVEALGSLDSVRYVSPPAQHWGEAIGLTIGGLAFAGVAIGMFWNGWWLGLAFCVFAPFFFYGALDAWLGSSDVTIAGDRWTVRSGWYGFRGAGLRVGRSEIKSITAKKSNVQSNNSNKPATKHLIATIDGGKKVTLVRSINGTAATRKLLADLRQRAGHDTK